ncbi:MAG: hypothetical protein ACYCW6_08070 [Candidatus Xenobia bacterium]
MGFSVDCDQIDGTRREAGRASLEGDLLEFRSVRNVRIRVRLETVGEVTAQAGILTIRYGRNVLHLDLGERAERWAEHLRHPPTRLDKLGVKPRDTVHVAGDFAEDFLAELEARGVGVVTEGATWLLYRAAAPALLNRLPSLGSARGMWIVYPRREVKEQHVLQAARSAGLAELKAMRFSRTESAVLFVPRKSG